MPRMSAPETIDPFCTVEQYLAGLQRQGKQAEDLVSGLTTSQLNWRPDAGRSWSIAQCIEHLSATNRIYSTAMRKVVRRSRDHAPRGSGMYRPGGWLTRRFIVSMEPPPKQKYRAFGRIQPAPAEYQGETVLSDFLAAQEDLRAFVSECRELDLGGIRFWNPFLKGVLFTVSSGLLLIGAHNRRHLWQAEQVKGNAGLPR